MTLTTASTSLDALLDRSVEAARALRTIPDAERAEFLEAVADALDSARDELVAIAHEETHLAPVRLTGEVARTTGQLRLFAAVVREGSFREAIIDHAAAEAVPPRPDLRRILVPLGPVANFAASNFPFAFSIAGGDTAAALAAGCPVIVKGHSGHPGLSRRTAEIVTEALLTAGAPEGVFALVEGREAGTALVAHPSIRAASFTGSVTGGRALFDIATGRPDPIPFYGELGSVNPVVVTPAASAARAEELGLGLAGSFTLGAGQFCTKPGIVFVPEGSGIPAVAAESAAGAAAAELLTPSIGDAFTRGWAELAALDGVEVLTEATSGSDGVTPGLVRVPLAVLLAEPLLREELFGPATLLVTYAELDDVVAALAAFEGSLTGTVHAEPGEDVEGLVAVLAERVGRVLFGGWPTGVAVTWSQQHGGPWPATTSLFTSVGATSVRRFQRPIAFQDAPEALLPPELRDDAVPGLPRRVDGVLVPGDAR
ncbi:NADP-dependent aldehyde dehydrogenase [Rathayibacter sp. PhB152]|uniref:aldehyde dehydrogenase (NADP(+)) n=1 Tax=Rathayibacter sp. PhB152 TaxID=2485190 RepID=UPI000F4AFDF4|nr:aldehyde dehydrogenase (NADP(+)) [Rathayibacter sp. PhB152]ROQ64159.1 NADP-dependent aldehyde dehydrogenase [Rathayibacter sp. PhB152]